MTIETTRPEIRVVVRHIGLEAKVRDYALDKLGKIIYSLPSLKSASVELGFEHTRPANKRYVAQVTLSVNGTLLRVEDRGDKPHVAIDRVCDLLERRIRDWKGRVYFGRRREAAVFEEVAETEATRTRSEDQTMRIVRKKSFEIKPMFPEDAIEQMELLGHDFFLFLSAETGRYAVVYRRKAGGYGVIEPAMSDMAPMRIAEAS